MVKITRNIVKNPKSIYGFNNERKKITIHETDNTSEGANADAHARLQQNGYSASWHYQVDDKEVIQSYDHKAQCWHAGDGRGPGNLHSIGIEICVNSDGDYLKAVDNAVWLVKKIMAEENLTVNDVVQHNHWSGKNCPRRLRAGSHGVAWSQFIDKIKGGTCPSKPVADNKATHQGNSIVTYLNSIKVDSSMANRKKLASKHGISNYKGTAEQNLKLLEILRNDQPVNKPKAINIAIDGYWGAETTRALQKALGTVEDGIISRPSLVVKALQKKVGAKQDGYLGPETTQKLQKYLGTVQDGKISKPSMVVKEMQRRLNAGTF